MCRIEGWEGDAGSVDGLTGINGFPLTREKVDEAEPMLGSGSSKLEPQCSAGLICGWSFDGVTSQFESHWRRQAMATPTMYEAADLGLDLDSLATVAPSN